MNLTGTNLSRAFSPPDSYLTQAELKCTLSSARAGTREIGGQGGQFSTQVLAD